MKLELDNSQRVFLVLSNWGGVKVFCNLSQLNGVVNDLGLYQNSFTIYEYWNFKLSKVSKKSLKELFEANQLKQNFKY